MTGCLRVAKESFSTGLNNPEVLSISNVQFDEYFGISGNDVVRHFIEKMGNGLTRGEMEDLIAGETDTKQILAMFRTDVAKDGETLQTFCNALQTGNAPEVEWIFSEYLGRTVSIRDTFVRKPTIENFFHNILLGFLGYKNGQYIKSGQESGDGCSDIIIHIEDDDIRIIIEVKDAKKSSDMA